MQEPVFTFIFNNLITNINAFSALILGIGLKITEKRPVLTIIKPKRVGYTKEAKNDR
jgi:hypothetical protein